MSQKDIVLDYLKTGKSITQLEAWLNYKSFCLAQIIHSLRSDGYPIETTMRTNSNTKKSFASYRLIAVPAKNGQLEMVMA